MPARDAAAEAPFGSLTRHMADLLKGATRSYAPMYRAESWAPNVNLYETEQSYLVCVDLAGVRRDAIELVVHEGQLHVTGSREVPVCPTKITDEEPEAARCRLHLMEIDHGAFRRAVELPSGVDESKISAAHRNGLLWVELPKVNA